MKIVTSRKLQATLLICFAIILEISSACLIYGRNNSSMKSYIEILYYTSQIISSIFVVSGVVIAVWQYYLTSKSTKTDIEIQQVQRAIDLSEYYKDNILKYSAAIEYIFHKTGVLKILNTLKLESMNHFDKYELNDLLTKEQIQSLKDIQDSDLFVQTIIEANTIYNLHLEIQSENIKIDTNGETEYFISVNKRSAIVAFLSNLVANVLNNMEFFALHFSHKTADESVVYQSLHQSYFDLIRLLYYYIAKSNENPSDKFYTNIINLFTEWRSTKNDQKESRFQTSKNIPRNGTIIQK